MEHISDCDLIAQIRKGNERAFAVMMHRHSRRVYAHVAHLVRSSDDVEDLVQIVFVKVFRNLDRLRNVAQFEAWLHRLVRNAVYSWHRRQMVQLRFEDVLREMPVDEVDVQDDVQVMVRAALATLSREHGEVVAHHYLKGYSYAETASLLHVTVDTVRGRLKRARVRLKKELETMVDIEKQTFELNGADLDALNKARNFVSVDEKRPLMQGICLDVGGRIVATNGHVLFVRTLENLASLVAPTILGPWTGVALLEGERARLVLEESEAVIQIANQKDVRVPIIEGPFVQYEQVMPKEDPVLNFLMDSALLLQALDLLADHMDARHPVVDDWEYLPQMELHVSSVAQTVTFLTSRDLGYRRSVGAGKMESFAESGEAVSPGGAVDWAFQVPLFGAVDSVGEETLRIGVSFTYFRDMLDALEIGDCESVTLAFRGPTRPILFSTAEHLDWVGLVMPLRLAGVDKSE